MSLTHYVYQFDSSRKFQRTLCAAYIPMAEHSEDPTCPTCLERVPAIRAHEAEMERALLGDDVIEARDGR